MFDESWEKRLFLFHVCVKVNVGKEECEEKSRIGGKHLGKQRNVERGTGRSTVESTVA